MFEIDPQEIATVRAALLALRCKELQGGCVWLRVDDDQRTWVVANEFGYMCHEVNQSHDRTTFGWIAISDRLPFFAEAPDHSPVFFDVIDGTAVIAYPGVSLAIDLVAKAGQGPQIAEFTGDVHTKVSEASFTRIISAARMVPSGGNDIEWPSPPMWLNIDEHHVALHVDWNDIVSSRSTFRVDAQATTGVHEVGSPTVSIAHAIVCGFLDNVPDSPSDDLLLSVGTDTEDDDQQLLSLIGDGWELVTKITNPLDERWGERLDTLCAEQPWGVQERRLTEWLITAGNRPVRITLHHGHPDTARVSTPVLSGAEESVELLRELNSINVAAEGRRFVLIDGTVHVIVDTRLSEFVSLIAAVNDVISDAQRFAPLLSVFSRENSTA